MYTPNVRTQWTDRSRNKDSSVLSKNKRDGGNLIKDKSPSFRTLCPLQKWFYRTIL